MKERRGKALRKEKEARAEEKEEIKHRHTH
jgi:hypothetical protein